MAGLKLPMTCGEVTLLELGKVRRRCHASRRAALVAPVCMPPEAVTCVSVCGSWIPLPRVRMMKITCTRSAFAPLASTPLPRILARSAFTTLRLWRARKEPRSSRLPARTCQSIRTRTPPPMYVRFPIAIGRPQAAFNLVACVRQRRGPKNATQNSRCCNVQLHACGLYLASRIHLRNIPALRKFYFFGKGV